MWTTDRFSRNLVKVLCLKWTNLQFRMRNHNKCFLNKDFLFNIPQTNLETVYTLVYKAYSTSGTSQICCIEVLDFVLLHLEN